jgi:hypothetical protein
MPRHAAALLSFAVLALAMTWPLAQHLPTHVVKAKWFYDSMVNLQILGSRLHYALGSSEGLKTVYDNYFCAPTQFSIAHNESLFGLVLLYAPFYLLTHDALLSYNLLLLLCLTLSGFFTYLLVRELTGNALAGVLSGVGFAFCPYVFFELGRIQLVATQWVPLFAFFLHRAAARGDKRSLAGVALTFAMQVGSCLYYAMFLAVYGLFVGVWLVIRSGTASRTFFIRLGVAALLVGTLTAGMVYPYFKARKDFGLVRSQELTVRYSGRLVDLAQVYPANRTLSFLHNAAEGPAEPIAFPGFTLLLLSALALTLPVAGAFRRASAELRRSQALGVGLSLGTLLLAVLASVLARNMVAGLVVTLCGVWLWRRLRKERLLPPLTFLYVAVLLVSVALFLGPWPFTIDAQPVSGLYYYFYRYVPGFDGIRYVSRFAVLIMLALSVLGGYGAALLLSGRRQVSWTVFGVLLVAMLLELRNAPVTLAQLPNRFELPAVYKWLAQHPGPEPIATMPAYTMGYYGARNDYLALFHRRRTIDGKSSWMPPITYAYIYETRRFPRTTGTTMLQALGAKYLVLHTEEMRGRGPRVLHWLDGRPESYKKRFASGAQYIYEILPAPTSSVSLLSTPPLPKGAVKIPRTELWGHAMNQPAAVLQPFDGDPKTIWSSGRNQWPGDWFEIGFARERKVVALELHNFEEAFELPAAFTLSAADAEGKYRPVFVRPALRFYADQVYHPRSFVFRVVLPEPVLTRGLRIELLDTVAGRKWAMHEATVWAM